MVGDNISPIAMSTSPAAAVTSIVGVVFGVFFYPKLSSSICSLVKRPNIGCNHRSFISACISIL